MIAHVLRRRLAASPERGARSGSPPFLRIAHLISLDEAPGDLK